jgi:hypothetical protein
MKKATDEQVKEWKVKYSNDLEDWFNQIIEDKLTLTELASLMNISIEGARKYFYRYFSNEELEGTKFYKQVSTRLKSEDSIIGSDSRLVEIVFNQLQEMFQPHFNLVETELVTIKAELLELAKDFGEKDAGIFQCLLKFKGRLDSIDTKLNKGKR